MTPLLNAAVIVDTFDLLTLDPMWALNDSPASYTSGGGFALGSYGGMARFDGVGNYAYAHIQTAGEIDTTGGIRVDAIMRQDHYPVSTWGMGVGIYFDANNWVSIKQCAASDQSGYMKDVMLGGVHTTTMSADYADLRHYWLISGVELTSTQIKFYGSSIVPLANQYGVTDIDGNVHLIGEFTMAKPAGFTGNALVIIGKGYTNSPDYPNFDFDNSLASGNWAFSGIDYARITYVSEPVTSFCGDSNTVYLDMDFNKDCQVDFRDFADFAFQWLQCTTPQDADCAQHYANQTFGLGEIDPYINITKTQTSQNSLDQIDVKMALGEYRDSIFMVTAYDNPLSLQIAVKGTLPPTAVLVQETLYLPNRGGVDTGDGVYPLEGNLAVPAHESRQVRLRFNARDSGIQPITYVFTVTVTDTFVGLKKVIPGTLEVWNFQLPSHDNLSNNTYSEFNTSEFYSGPALTRAVQQMKPYGFNIIYVHPAELPRADSVDSQGNILHFDSVDFERRVIPILSAWNSAPGSEKIMWMFSLSSYYSLGMSEQEQNLHPFLSATWHNVYHQWLGLFRDKCRALGIADGDWVITFNDEPDIVSLQTYNIPWAESTRAYDAAIKQHCNSAARFSDQNWTTRYFAAFDIFEPPLDYILGTTPDYPYDPLLLPWLKTSGKTIRTYRAQSDWGLVGKNVYEYYRIYGWYLAKYEFSGIGIWTYCASTYYSPWVTPNVGNVLTFKHFGKVDVVHSRRMEMYREGIDDYRYICALRTIAAQKNRTSEAEQLIQQAITDITTNRTDTSRCEYWRLQIAQRILTYQTLQ